MNLFLISALAVGNLVQFFLIQLWRRDLLTLKKQNASLAHDLDMYLQMQRLDLQAYRSVVRNMQKAAETSPTGSSEDQNASV